MPKCKLDKEEVIELLDSFLNETGNWYTFCDYLRERGYSPEDLGLDDE